MACLQHKCNKACGYTMYPTPKYLGATVPRDKAEWCYKHFKQWYREASDGTIDIEDIWDIHIIPCSPGVCDLPKGHTEACLNMDL